jgi:hypothetical protein
MKKTLVGIRKPNIHKTGENFSQTIHPSITSPPHAAVYSPFHATKSNLRRSDVSLDAIQPTRLNSKSILLTLLLAAFTSVSLAAQAQTCSLNSAGGKIQHIIYVQFDNVHFTRDNPNVPSDLEQMPNLLNFLTNNGTLLTNHHTPLIAHTADDILTSLTGVYPSNHGQAVSNSFGFFPLPGTSSFFDGFASSFTYWTDPVNVKTDPNYSMITANGMNAPAPWVPYTRAGCNVGAASIANIELENVTSDITTVFGANSPEALEAKANRTKAIADFEGIAVHCAANDPICSATNGGVPDLLPQEPGSYQGFNGLFGHAFVAPVISPSGPLTDLDGNLITDGHGNNGFPGFGGISASQTLSYVAAMQEHNIPVTFAYISDAHDDHVNFAAFGPGQAGYVAQLKAYDEAWGKFFARLAADGISKDNTLFIITADEGDHFAGGAPTPANCDGVNVACTYPAGDIGEILTNLTAVLDAQDSGLTSSGFDIHFDMAPTFYLNPAGPATAREFERAAAQITGPDAFTGTNVPLAQYLADPVEMKLLHMVTGDPQRTPNFVMFGNPDFYFQTSGSPTFAVNNGFAWNHGGVAPEINTTFLGLVGPGVANQGVQNYLWSDHTDIRPTILLLAGLTDDYSHDGRALVEALQSSALPKAVRQSELNFILLASAYKQITAPVGFLGLTSLQVSTRALAGDDTTYANLEAQLSSLTQQRDAVAAQIIQLLEGAEFNGKPIDFKTTVSLLIRSAQLLAEVQQLQNGH